MNSVYAMSFFQAALMEYIKWYICTLNNLDINKKNNEENTFVTNIFSLPGLPKSPIPDSSGGTLIVQEDKNRYAS